MVYGEMDWWCWGVSKGMCGFERGLDFLNVVLSKQILF